VNLMAENSNPTPQKARVVSGMRPTGKLHLGHYVGALENWIRLQDQYECFFFVADWHALTTDYADTSNVQQNTIEMALDWLACGLDPAKATLFVQSHVPEHAELNLLLSLITPLGWLERVPTYKEQRENIQGKDLGTHGFLGYPVLQAADILMYRAHYVPVGEDQVPHVELTREIARRFNNFYRLPQPRKDLAVGASVTAAGSLVEVETQEVFPEPLPLLTPTPKLPGLDGRKMSKSYGNYILLSEEPAAVQQKLQTMVNDPHRARREDPGDPDICPVGDLHKIFSTAEVQRAVHAGCRTAGISCIECKGWVADSIIRRLAPLQARRRRYAGDVQSIVDILEAGSRKAQFRAAETLKDVRRAMKMGGEFREEALARRRELAGQDASGGLEYPMTLAAELWDFQNDFERAEKVRALWLKRLPSEVVLRQAKPGMYTSQQGRRVGVHTSRDLGGHEEWRFLVPDRHHDILVLLCWHADRETITEILLPQRIVQPEWKRLPLIDDRSHRQVDVYRHGGSYYLNRTSYGQAPLMLDEYVNNLRPLLP
jgi:tryptophanyl-tRNA synthetase